MTAFTSESAKVYTQCKLIPDGSVNLTELPIPQLQDVGRCELCGSFASLRPVIYKGVAMKIHWECIYRIQEGLPPLEVSR